MMRYRLLDTTRAYALDTSGDSAEAAELAMRHAIYFRQWLEQTGTEWSTLSTGLERSPHFAGLNNARAALEWCFGANGNAEIGIGLAAAAVPVFLAMSLLPECHRWSERALLVLGNLAPGSSEEMHLQAGIGISSMQIFGQNEASRLALSRSLSIAEQRGDKLNQAGFLGMLHMFHFRSGDFKSALDFARRCRSLADTIEDPDAVGLSHSILGRSLHLMGDHVGARAELEATRRYWSRTRPASTIYLGYDRHYRAGIALARTLWLQGHPVQAVERANEAIAHAERMDHPGSIVVVLAWAASVFLWCGDLEVAAEHINSSISMAESYSLGPLIAVGRGRKGELAIRRGEAQDGVESLRASLAAIHAVRYELLTPEFNISLAQGLAATGYFAEGFALIDETIRRVETNGEALYMPELLRVKGGLLRSSPQPSIDGAEAHLSRSLDLSRRQGALGWELRAATDLASLLVEQGQPENGRVLLQPVFERFAEGFDTADLTAARSLLSTLG